MEKCFVQYSISSHPKQVKVTNWLTGESQYVNVYSDTSFNEFVNMTADKLLLNILVLYALPPPDYSWKERVRVSEGNFRKVVSSVISGSLVDRPHLYAHPCDNSECSPLHLKRTADDVSSLGSEATDRSGQDDFKRRIRFRDNSVCVFCGFNGQPLYAAHILEYALFKEDENKFKEYDIMGINDTLNGITLCWNCHQAFDNNLVCVSPDSKVLIVAEALQHCEPAKWQKLHGAKVFDAGSFRMRWPNNKLLSYRQDVMNKKAEEREKNGDEYPYRCEHCHAGCKTLMGLMNRHGGSQKCVKMYTTPRKTVIDEEECIYEFE